MKYRVDVVRFNMRVAVGCTIGEWYNSIERSKMRILTECQIKRTLTDWKIVLGTLDEDGCIMPIEDLVMLIAYEEDKVGPYGNIKEFSDYDAARLYYELYESDNFNS